MHTDIRRRVLLPLLVLGTPLLHGCTAGMAMQVDESFVPPVALGVERLAVMPVTTEAGSEGIRETLARSLRSDLVDRFPELVVVGSDEARARLARSPAARDYADLLEDYERTGVVESDGLRRVADALGVDHFLQVRAAYLRENFLDTSLFGDDEVATEDRQVVAVVARLWGTGGSAPVWEAVVRIRSETDDFQQGRREVGELLEAAADGVGERLPIRRPVAAAPVEPRGGPSGG